MNFFSKSAFLVMSLFLSVVIPAVSAAVQPTEVWIDDDYCATCSNDGHVWGTDAFAKIQDGINAVAVPGQVHVAAGIYIENIDFIGKSISVKSTDGPELTIIDGNRKGPVVSLDSWEGPLAMVSGFTIRNGGGVILGGASPKIIGNIIETNSQIGTFGSAGIGGNVSSPVIEKNIFRNNSCDTQYLSAVVSFINSSSPRIVNNIFENNPCRAIVIAVSSGAPVVINNTIVGNRTGVLVNSAGEGVVRNNILVENEIGLELASGMRLPLWEANLVFGNQTDYSGISDQTGINGNISADPKFIDLLRGDYGLRIDSPAVDAGSATGAPVDDFEGTPRPQGTGFDMGAFELSDYTPPDTLMTSTPSDPSNSSSAIFRFMSTEATSTFQCRLDSGNYASCVSPITYRQLSDGAHNFYVKAVDAVGNGDKTPASCSWTISAVIITGKPTLLTNSSSAAFEFTSAVPGATYLCKLDGGSYASCSSPKEYTGLTAGTHTFKVKFVGAEANTTPASYSWTIDTDPPAAPNVSGDTPTNNKKPTWVWSSGGNGGSGLYRYRLDNAVLTGVPAVTATIFTPGVSLSLGPHTLYVQERDVAGNWSLSGSFTVDVVDTIPPDTVITSTPEDLTRNTAATFAFSSTEAGSTFQCRLDGGVYVSCSSPFEYMELKTGSHTFNVRASDQSGNTDPSSASYTWTIDTSIPALVSVSPTPITTEQGTAQVITAVYSDPEGYSNLDTVGFLVTTSGGIADAILAEYNREENRLYLYGNDGISSVGSCNPGEMVRLSNSQGALNCDHTTVAASGYSVKVGWSITPDASFTGIKQVKIRATDNAGNTTIWGAKAKWTIIAANTNPSLGTLSPSSVASSAGRAESFSAIYRDADGYANLKAADFLVSSNGETINALFVRYIRNQNKLYLYNDAGNSTVGSCTPGAAGTLSNGQGMLNCGATTVSSSRTTLTVKWNITPKAAFGGTKQIRMRATDNSNAASQLITRGSWSITN